MNTLLSEAEIKQFLPGQRDPETLAMIEKMLGEAAYVNRTHSGRNGRFGVEGFNLQEHEKPLMTADEIRRTDKTILFVRRQRPSLTTLPSIAEIAPWRKQIGVNPFYGKPYLKRVTLRLRNRNGGWLRRLFGMGGKS